MVACATALSSSPQIAYAVILVAFGYLVAAHGEFVNFAYDYEIDKQNPRMKKFATVTGKISISKVKEASYITLLLAFFTGGLLILIKKEVLLLVLLAIHSQYSYSAPPLRLKKYWWGGFATYTMYTGVLILISAIILGAGTATAAITALAFWLGSLSLWTLAGIPDKTYDKKEGVETPATKFGNERCILAYILLALLSSILSAGIVIKLTNRLDAGLPFLIPAAIGITAYLRMKKEAGIRISENALSVAKLPYRYNMGLVTLSYFIFLST